MEKQHNDLDQDRRTDELIEKGAINPFSKKEVQKMYKNKYRYACPHCTNVAFRSLTDDVGKSVICESCGKTVKTEKQNYIKL